MPQSNTEQLKGELQRLQDSVKEAKKELKQTEKKKEHILQEAYAAIERDRDEWIKTKESYKKQAWDEGYKEGFSTGNQEGMDQYQELLNKANQIIESAWEDYHSTIEQSEEAIIDLAIYVAEKITRQKIEDEPLSFLPIVKAAIKELKDQSIVTIYVHPDNYETVFQHREELVRLMDGDANVTIRLKNELPPDSCIIEHPFGKIDASIDTQLNQIREILHNVSMEKEQ